MFAGHIDNETFALLGQFDDAASCEEPLRTLTLGTALPLRANPRYSPTPYPLCPNPRYSPAFEGAVVNVCRLTLHSD